MVKKGKKHLEVVNKVDRTMKYNFHEAVQLALDSGYAKFDETLDLAVRLVAEQAISQLSSGSDGDRCQRYLAGDIPDSIDAGHIGIFVGINRNYTVGQQVHPGDVEGKARRIRTTTDRPDNDIECGNGFISTAYDNSFRGLRKAGRLETGMYLDTLAMHFPFNHIADHRVETFH